MHSRHRMVWGLRGGGEKPQKFAAPHPGSPARPPAAPPLARVSPSAWAVSRATPGGFREAGRASPGWAAPPERLVSARAGGGRAETDLSSSLGPSRSPPSRAAPPGLWKRRWAAAAAQGHPLPRRPRPLAAPPGHTWAPPRVRGPGLRGAWRGRGERPAPRGGPDPNWGPVAKKPDPRLGLRQQPGAAASPIPPPPPTPSSSRKASGAAALRRPQAETRTLDGGSVGESPAGGFDGSSPAPPRLRDRGGAPPPPAGLPCLGHPSSGGGSLQTGCWSRAVGWREPGVARMAGQLGWGPAYRRVWGRHEPSVSRRRVQGPQLCPR